MSLERVGTAFLIVITVATVATVGVAGVYRAAADDVYATIAQAQGISGDHTQTAIGTWLAARLAPHMPTIDDLTARQAAADLLAARSDRLREFTGVQGLTGLLVAILTGRPTIAGDARREAIHPAANTTSTGTA